MKIKQLLSYAIAASLSACALTSCDSGPPDDLGSITGAGSTAESYAVPNFGDFITYTTNNGKDPLVQGFTYAGLSTSFGGDDYIYTKNGSHGFLHDATNTTINLDGVINQVLDDTELGTGLRLMMNKPVLDPGFTAYDAVDIKKIADLLNVYDANIIISDDGLSMSIISSIKYTHTVTTTNEARISGELGGSYFVDVIVIDVNFFVNEAINGADDGLYVGALTPTVGTTGTPAETLESGDFSVDLRNGR